MEQNEREKRIIENYQQDEKMMILIYAQWCVNNDLDPKVLYKEAYPEQMENHALVDALNATVPKEEADDIADEIVLQVLQLFGNDDLAFIVVREIDKRKLAD